MENIMCGNVAIKGLLAAVQRYFDLMYDCDVSKFPQVFWTTAQLHGFRDGTMIVWPYATYKDVLSKRQSPNENHRRGASHFHGDAAWSVALSRRKRDRIKGRVAG